MYHINFGYPLLDEGVRLILEMVGYVAREYMAAIPPTLEDWKNIPGL